MDEHKFLSKYSFITRIVKQINNTYQNNCFDATAVLLRRLFEITIILVYRNLHLDHDIKEPTGNYLQLNDLIAKLGSDTRINVSRIKASYPLFQKIGNYSAHKIEYNASRKDIDDIRIDYRTALEELFHKGNLFAA